MDTKRNCWDVMGCGRQPGGSKVGELGVCKAALNAELDGFNGGQAAGRMCWTTAGTFCGGKEQGTFAQKALACLDCRFLQTVKEEEKEGFRFLAPGQEFQEVAHILGELRKQEASIRRAGEESRRLSDDLGAGVTELLSVLREVQRGNFEVRVSEATLASNRESLAQLGAALNQTIDELRELNRRQQIAIRELSTPVLQIWDGVVAVPIVGTVDSSRCLEMMERLLQAVVELRTRFVILDITGVELVDTKTADHFLKIVRAAQLVGARCIVTGVQPAVAQTLVDLGVDLSSIRTLRDLQAGLRECLRELKDAR